MLQNARVVPSTVSELLRENQQGGKGKITPHPDRVNIIEKYSPDHFIFTLSKFSKQLDRKGNSDQIRSS